MIPLRFVVDTSVAVKWFLTEPGSGRALELRDAAVKRRSEMLAPDIIHSEFANALWKRVVFNGMDSLLAGGMVSAFQELPIGLVGCKALAPQAFDIACRHKRSVYDCLFLSLSVAADAPLMTADETFYKAVRSSFPKVSWVG